MKFPAEIIEIVASHLSPSDQYQGLTVCRNWYQPFCRSLYRHIQFKDRQQFKKWFSSQHKDLVRSIQFGTSEKYHSQQQQISVDRVTGAIPLHSTRVGVTSDELVAILNELPLLDSIQFDSRLWQYLNTQQVQKAAKDRLLALPALDHPKQLSFIQSKRGLLMSRLHLRGSDIFKLHKKNLFLKIFQSTPFLEELIIDADGIGDAKHAMLFSIQDIEVLHLSLPNLKRLDLIDSVRLVESSSSFDNQQAIAARPSRLEKLHLSVLIEKYAIPQWFRYFSWKYPQLFELTLSLSSPFQIPRQQMAPENQEKLDLASFINSLARLEKLVIDNNTSRQYLCDTTISPKNKYLNQLQLGLWGDSLETTVKALQCVISSPGMTHSTSYLCIPLWSSQNSIDFSVLANLRQLAHLEVMDKSGQQLKQNSAHHDNNDQTNSGYPIDIILASCPYLTSLKLVNGQITAKQLLQRQSHSNLRSIRMDRVAIHETNDLFTCLSATCQNLKDIFLRQCISDSFDLVMSNSNLC
ncbi:hypothetical protein [Parasitella parasitica]|uniref:F-box domain-containing protein n=1 Tax=Parasitella parasitica TaxID=35722 RepID=A0A0B7NWC5_9FUNG|nr:hypothetical protein [Parasitella parasitica]